MENTYVSRRGTTIPGEPRPQYLSDAVDLAPHPGSVAVARLHCRHLLRAWGLGELRDDAEQILSEVTANAIESHQRERLEAPVRVVLLAGLRTLLLIVRDQSAAGPVLGWPAADAESGRGLLIVDALASLWDVKPAPGGGKAVRVFLRGQRGIQPEAAESVTSSAA